MSNDLLKWWPLLTLLAGAITFVAGLIKAQLELRDHKAEEAALTRLVAAIGLLAVVGSGIEYISQRHEYVAGMKAFHERRFVESYNLLKGVHSYPFARSEFPISVISRWLYQNPQQNLGRFPQWIEESLSISRSLLMKGSPDEKCLAAANLARIASIGDLSPETNKTLIKLLTEEYSLESNGDIQKETLNILTHCLKSAQDNRVRCECRCTLATSMSYSVYRLKDPKKRFNQLSKVLTDDVLPEYATAYSEWNGSPLYHINVPVEVYELLNTLYWSDLSKPEIYSKAKEIQAQIDLSVETIENGINQNVGGDSVIQPYTKSYVKFSSYLELARLINVVQYINTKYGSTVFSVTTRSKAFTLHDDPYLTADEASGKAVSLADEMQHKGSLLSIYDYLSLVNVLLDIEKHFVSRPNGNLIFSQQKPARIEKSMECLQSIKDTYDTYADQILSDRIADMEKIHYIQKYGETITPGHYSMQLKRFELKPSFVPDTNNH